jgi:TolB-like protein
VNHYRVTRRLGEGGMGVVWEAADERLGRPVALKMIRDHQTASPAFRERFWREARAAARVNHPNVCQIYEIGEFEGVPFLVMELLQGEALDRRLNRGAMPVPEAVRVATQMLAALGALHKEGLVHRDLKPSNLYLTPNGVKLLDFGLVRLHEGDDALSLTQSGMMIGTPSYMSPEQASGRTVGSISDIFSAGSVLYEMLAGRRAFAGKSVPEILLAVVNQQPPALAGTPEVARLDRIVARALDKRPEHRYRSAEEMLADLAAVPIENGASTAASGYGMAAHALTRLIVLPFRMLVPDAETGFLAYSLPDAVSSTLAGLESLVVRSSMMATQFDPARPDLKAIAREAEVDAVVTGSLLRAGDQIRVTSQLVEAPGGTVLHSHSAQAGMRDLFQLQDDLVQQLVASLKIPLTARDTRALGQKAPASNAYEMYLRANDLIQDWKSVEQARELYRQCVETDPEFAPAWARLGRAERLIAKYADQDERFEAAERALQRALSINSDLALAHNLYAQLEADSGRAQSAMIRLLRRAMKTGNDPELFAGLVHVCRYCGLLEASIAAHQRARRLDPKIATSVFHTYFLKGDYESCLGSGETGFLRTLALVMLDRVDEARAVIREQSKDVNRLPPRVQRFFHVLARAVDETGTEAELSEDLVSFANVRDPEGVFYWSRYVSRLGHPELAVHELGNAVDQGYYCVDALLSDPWLVNARTHPDFGALVELARVRREQAREAFIENGGEKLLCCASTDTQA